MSDKNDTEAPYDIPETIEEAVEIMLLNTNDKDKEVISKMQEKDLTLIHHGFGTCIRNNFKMWDPESKLVQDCAKRDNSIKHRSHYIHPDDASGVVIKAFWEKLNERDRNLSD